MPVSWVDRLDSADVTDGLSHTLLSGELHVPAGKLGVYPENSPIYDGEHLFSSARLGGPGVPLGKGPADVSTNFLSFGSWHSAGCQFVVADGSVRVLRNEIDTITLGQLSNRSNGEVVDSQFN